MFSFFFPKKQEPDFNLGFLETDFHSHLLPGIDDGAKDIEDSLILIKHLVDFGFKRLITTPHIMSEVYPNNTEIITEKLNIVRERLKVEGINIELRAAAEYFMDESFLVMLDKGEPLLPIFDNYVLVEMSYLTPLNNLLDYLFRIELAGYKTVLAHPERYTYYFNNYNIYKEVKERGTKLQLNILSLNGYYGEKAQKTANRLLNDNLIDYIATDTHHTRHINSLQALTKDKKIKQLLLNQEFQNKFIK